MSKYKVLDELGRGGMGVVLKSHQVDLDRIVAMKILNEESTADPSRRARFPSPGRSRSSRSCGCPRSQPRSRWMSSAGTPSPGTPTRS